MTKENNGCLPKIDDDPGHIQSRRSEIPNTMHERTPESTIPKQLKGNVHFKILVPSIAAGAIIGKGGEAITDIQNKTAAKVKMSKANDFYPGTTERVCLIVGTTESILRVFQYISEKIYEKPESLLRTPVKGCRIPAERHKQVKILVPNSTAGIIIGKGGSFIKEVKEQTGVFIQVSQKSKELNLAERCVTIAGDLSQTYEAVKQLLAKIADDPQSSSCPNISYAEMPRPVASAYPTGSPYALALGSGYTTSAPDPLLGGGGVQTNPVPNSNTFHPPQLGTFSPVSSVGSSTASGPMFGTSQPSALAAAAAMSAMGAANSFPPGITMGTNRTGSMLPSQTAAARALTGRGGGAVGHHSSVSPNSPHSLLGSGAALCGTNASVYGAPSPINSASSSNSAIGLEVVRNILRSAGYSDVATEEIANAMNVLNLYGFISMSSLTGCATGAGSVNNGHFQMAGTPVGGLAPSISGYLSGGPQSPVFTNEISGQLRGMRGFGISCTPCPNQYASSKPTHPSATQPVHPRMNSCASACQQSSFFPRDIKVHDSSVSTAQAITCDVPEQNFTENLYSNMSIADAISMQSPTNSPLHTRRAVSPLLPVIPKVGANGNAEVSVSHEFIQRLSDGPVGTKLKTGNGSSRSSTDSGTNGTAPNNLWNLSCPMLQPSNSSS